MQSPQYIEATSKAYPGLLTEYSRLPGIYAVGDVALLQKPMISVVGSRNMSAYGQSVLQSFIPQFIEMGMVIVSGMADGADSFAQQLALDNGGKVVGVCGHGHNFTYPSSKYRLFENIANQGCLLSQYAPEVSPQKFRFRERNVIIAAMSMVTLVIEAGYPSGTLLTAQAALEYNRTVCVVPGDITRPQSKGILKLMQQGAEPVGDASQVLQHYQLTLPTIRAPKLRPALTGTAASLYASISGGVNSLSALQQHLQLPQWHLRAALTLLELDGYICRRKQEWHVIS